MGSITVKSLGKAYKQYHSKTARLKEVFFPALGLQHQKHWVLQDINFHIDSGETVGVIGINGAGKSTLLKIIAGITAPTVGSVEVAGRMAAMLELGMGFHPEFTGRQNIYMAGQLLGFTMAEITQMLPDIQDFAEIGDYFDRPFRTYSSGMQMRLAFSLATARRPEILIVDEALSVGDAYFQHKSFERIRSFRANGTTLLLVSHNRQVVQSICDRALFLNQGRLEKEGDPEVVLDYYHAVLARQQEEAIKQRKLADGSFQTVSGSGEVTIEAVRIVNSSGSASEMIKVGEEITLETTLLANEYLPQLIFGFMIRNQFGQIIFGVNTLRLNQVLTDVKAGERKTFRYTFNANLGKGNYSISLSASQFDSHLDKNYCWIDRALIFHVVNFKDVDFVGCNWLPTKVSIESLNT